MITFIIPTWNRPFFLNKAVRSIAAQIKPDCKILISDHGSDDGETPDLIEKLKTEFPFISSVYCERAKVPDFSHNFKFCFGLGETEWTWTFGDDDILLPGAMDVVYSLCRSERADFYHLSEDLRSTDSKTAIPGMLISLCNMLGFVDMTGFITGNVVRTKYMKQAFSSPYWDIYARSAFPQSLALLEALADRPAAFIDALLIKGQTNGQTAESNANWQRQNIPFRYMKVIDGIESLVERAIIPKTVQNPFFRYHSYYLWDRFIGHMIDNYYYDMKPAHWEWWEIIERYSQFLEEKSKEVVDNEIKMVKDALLDHYAAIQKLKDTSLLVDGFIDRHHTERFPFTYLPKTKPDPEPIIARI